MQAAAIESALDLWAATRERAGLNLRLYDGHLLEELAESLEVSADEFDAALAGGQVTVEALLQALLKALAPYAAMTREVLDFFARAAARSTSDNLRIRFDFEDAEDSFDFDLENFRDWDAELQRVLASIAPPLRFHPFRSGFATKELRVFGWSPPSAQADSLSIRVSH